MHLPRRLIGLAAALALHLLALTSLLLGRAPEPQLSEPPSMSVSLVERPRATRAQPRSSTSRLSTPRTHRPLERPISGPLNTPAPTAPRIDPKWAVRLDTAAEVAAALRARRRCTDEAINEADWGDCPVQARAPEKPISDGVAPKDKQAEYARAAARNAAIKAYKAGGAFPGLRCSFGGAC